MGGHKEVALPSYRLKLEYNNPRCEEIVEIKASNSAEAREECIRVGEQIEKSRSEMKSKNIYCSKTLVSCSLVPKTWREEMLCESMLEDNV